MRKKKMAIIALLCVLEIGLMKTPDALIAAGEAVIVR
jgi:hypothetical protein